MCSVKVEITHVYDRKATPVKPQYLRGTALYGLAMWLAVSVPLAAGQAARPSARNQQPVKATLAVVGGYLIDGHDGPPVDNAVILVDGKEIVAVGTVDSLKVPPGTKVIDASGYTVMPGLFNTHVHLDLIGHADYDWWHEKYPPGSAGYTRVTEVGAHQLIM